MGILSSLFSRKSAQPMTEAQWVDWLDTLNVGGIGDNNPYVYRCKDLRAASVSALHPIVYDKDANEIPNHPLNVLLDRPNPRSTWRQLIYDCQIDIATTGNAYILPMATIKGVSELWRIPPECISYTATGDIFRPIERWVITTGTQCRCVEPEELIHVHTQLGADMVHGVSPMDAAGLSIRNQNDAREWNSSILNNGAKPTLIVQDPNTMTPIQFDIFKKNVMGSNSGKKNAGKIMILDGGKTASTAGFNATDMDFNRTVSTTAKEIAIAFGVPPEFLGDSENKTYSNAAESKREFALATVIPLANLVYEALTVYLRRYYKDFDHLGYDREDIDGLTDDFNEVLTALVSADFLTINEKRARLSYQEVEGGDVILQPLGQAPLSEVASDIDSLMDQGET